jgi:tRNA(Ile)-lysidine synthase
LPVGPSAGRPSAGEPSAGEPGTDRSGVDGPEAGRPGAGELIAGLLERCDWPDERRLDVAVSGGADSLALLVLARSAGLDVVAIHVDHGLRAGSAGEAAAVARAASRWGAAFEAVTVQVAPGPNVEARARAARYAALPAGVATGHTADDQAETVLLNLLRGAGLDGLAAMARGGRVRRPLLRLRRSETHALCAAVGLEVFADPSNQELRLRRNDIRHRLLPLIEDVAGRDPVPVLARQSWLLADDAALLDQLAAGLDPTDARGLAAAPLPLARRALRRWLRAGNGAEQHPPSAAEVARVLAVARGEVVACELSGGRRVARRAGRLRLEGAADHSGQGQ